LIPGAAGLCAALLDLEPADAQQLGAEVAALAAHLPVPARALLALGTAAAEAVAVTRTGHRLGHLDGDRRRALVAGLAATNAAAPLLDALKVPVLLAHGALVAAADPGSRDPGPPARPDAALDVTPAGRWPTRSVADAVVIGSGAGGAMAARTLAQAGLTVVVVEEGRRFTVAELRASPPIERFTAMYRDGGATVALGRPPVVLPVGRGVGGTTLVNSGTCYRTPTAVLDRWRDDHGVVFADPDAFGPLLDDVWTTLQVAAVPDTVMGANGQIALRGAAALGWSAHRLQRNAPGCGGCCQCAVGCPRNAKFGVHLSVLPAACAAGARIVTDARVERVLHGAGHATGVRARRVDGSTFEILAPHVVVAAGATETPLLLRRSGLGRHPHVGRNLAVHPALSTAGWFDEPVHATSGVLQSVGIDELHERHGILIEATATPPGMGSLLLPGVGRPLADQLARADHLATLGAMVGDAPNGRVRGTSHALVRYDLAQADARRLLRGVAAMGRVLFAAGATAVVTGIGDHPTVRSPAALDEAVASARPGRLHVAAFHPTGTVRMGADDQTHPVDPDGRLRGVDGVWVADASVLPSCPEVNPQVSIMAVALAVAGRCAARAGA
jgi:choline dehydrogenase-like flavoprotein